MNKLLKAGLLLTAVILALPVFVVSAVLATPTVVTPVEVSPMGTVVSATSIDYANGNAIRISDPGTSVLVSNDDENTLTVKCTWTPVVQSKLRWPTVKNVLEEGDSVLLGAFPKEMYADGWLYISYEAETTVTEAYVTVMHVAH